MFNDDSVIIESLVNKNQRFCFMNQIRGTSSYWKKFQHEVLAMVIQLGCSTIFSCAALSCEDVWKKIPKIVSELNNLRLLDWDLHGMNCFRKHDLVINNSVFLASRFQIPVEIFFQ